jgi:hypothetical protein
VVSFRIPFAGPKTAAGKLGKTPPGVMPAKAGIHRKKTKWIPACAGMTAAMSFLWSSRNAPEMRRFQEEKPDG